MKGLTRESHPVAVLLSAYFWVVLFAYLSGKSHNDLLLWILSVRLSFRVPRRCFCEGGRE